MTSTASTSARAGSSSSGNRIHHNYGGVLLYEDARGVLEDNEISDNFTTGIEVIEGARPVVRGNRIRRNGRQAILVNDGCGGTFEGNDLTGNAGGPWAIHVDRVPDVERRDNVTD